MNDKLSEDERLLVEAVKQATDIRGKPHWGDIGNKPYYCAGWLGQYENVFQDLVERGIAKWVYPNWEQMIYFPDEYPEGGEIANSD